ncbi:MAG TPA: WD40 repeat domain-containing protein [Gemmatales bacterium]|nr:WD40 repeat domain-containing protein [Gemmatales bacterium]
MKYTFATMFFLITLLLAWGQTGTGFDLYGDALPPGALARLGTFRFRHDAPIICQAVTNDGKLIATGGGRTVRVWDAATGKLLHVLTINQAGRSIAPAAVAFSPDGQMLAALGSFGQGVLMVWDLRGGQARQEMQLPQREDYSTVMMDMPFLSFTSNNKHLLVKNYSEKAIRHFDLETGMEMRSYQDVSTALTTMAISPDGHSLAAGTEGRQVILWDTRSGQELKRLQHDYPLVSLAFSPNGQQLAAMDQDLAPRIWNLATGKELHTLPARTRSVGIAWSTDGESLYVARQPDQLLTWNLKDQQEKTGAVPRGWVTGPLYLYTTKSNTDGLILGSLGRRGNNASRLRQIDLLHLDLARKFDGYDTGNLFAFYLPHRKQWASIGITGDNTLRLWDKHGRNTQSFDLPLGEVALRCFSVNSTGKLIALSAYDGRTFIIDTTCGQIQRTLSAFNRSCYDVEFSAEDDAIILTDVRHVKVIQLSTGKELKNYEISNTDPPRTLISSDGSRIASLVYVPEEEQLNMRVLEARTGRVLSSEVKMLVQNQNFYFSPDGRNILIFGNRGRPGGISVIEAASGKVRFQTELPAPYQFLSNQARVSPDGRWLVACGSGNDADQYAPILWRIGFKPDPIILQGHRGMVASVIFSNDTKQLLSVSNDSTMLVWNLNRYAPLPATPLDEAGFTKLWKDLADTDANKACQAIHRLAEQPPAAQWLGRQIAEKAVILKPEQIKEWITQLNSTQFNVREEATRQLIKHSVQARNALKAANADPASTEVKRRLDQILTAVRENNGLSDNPLQTTRAIETLEIIGTSEALKELEQLAERKDTIGSEARDASIRLRHRVSAPPPGNEKEQG